MDATGLHSAPHAGAAGRCPIDHSALSQQKTARTIEPPRPPVERDARGVWRIRGYAAARTVLRSADTRQAGFRAETALQRSGTRRLPILFQDGPPHHEQRRLTARYFTPATVSKNYRELMERYVSQAVGALRRRGQIDLSALSMWLAVRVAAQVVGLTDSSLPGMDRRLDAFFSNRVGEQGWQLRLQRLWGRSRILAFFWLDVKPAIAARRRQPREDVISHLLAQGSTDTEILTECITFGAAGMATTREFISVAAWHMLELPDLRAQYLAGDEEQRHALLHEILRLEPVVGHLYRRATADLSLDDGAITIPQGSLIDLDVYAINADAELVGEHPLLLCPGRPLAEERAGAAVMSFGDGHHRCPGAYIAIQETDILLQQLLRIEGLRIERKPSITWSELTESYEVRDFIVSIEGSKK
ncbi:MAG TPA: cytochrome P450 [Roseiflexaceae bacterium]|nr:cytochrome P450 [Roseiflexaceae bacterium]